MNGKLALVCIAISATLLAGCDQAKEPIDMSRTEAPSSVNQLPPQVSSTSAASKDGQAPIQGQVDPKEPPQRRDFETKKP